jgi:transposase
MNRSQALLATFAVLAAARLEAFSRTAPPDRRAPETLKPWIDTIVRMWRFTKSNGITEGLHNKMEMISRRAFGFRNFENYRIRVLAQCGWNGLITRV